MPTEIHPSAVVEPGAQLGVDCIIHPFALVRRWAILGDRVSVHPFAVVGGDTQDLKFERGSESWVRVGADTTIRESVTINRGTRHGGITSVGSRCLLMACCHVAHDCTVGNQVIIANAVLLAGHVTVGEHAILGGASVYHQSVQVGRGAMIGGGSRISLDLPPFTMTAERNEMVGLNLIGLKRQGASPEAIRELKEAYRRVYHEAGNPRAAAAKLSAEGEFKAAETLEFLAFFAGSSRGVARSRRGVTAEAVPA